MIPVQIRFTRKIIEYIDRLVADGLYSNRSEAIRDATRRLVVGTVPENATAPQMRVSGSRDVRGSELLKGDRSDR